MTSPSNVARSAGFTMLELIIVVIILGIVSSLAIPAFSAALNDTKLDAAASTVAATLSFARDTALSGHRPTRVVFDPALDTLQVQLQDIYKFSQYGSNPSLDEADVDSPPSATFQVMSHPSSGQPLILNFLANEPYGSANIVSASFSGSSTIRFNPDGSLSAGGTVTLQLGGRQRQVVVNAVSGDVSVN